MFVKYIRQTKVSSIPSCGKQVFSVAGNVVTQKRAYLTTKKVDA